MKILYYIFLLFICVSCSGEKVFDCIQAAGDIIQKEFVVNSFTQIRIEDDISLFIKQGPVQKVVIETGTNLLNDVVVKIEGKTIVIKNNNHCNLVRDYAITKVFITAPNITKIRNSSAFNVESQGVLNFPNLHLISNTTVGPETIRKSGDFTLKVNCEIFYVESNGLSGFYISGTVEKAVLSFEDEAPRFEGEDLIIQELRVFQRSANKMIVNPQQKIVGEIRGTGDIICLNRPPIIEVEEFFSGRLIFED